MTWVLDRFFWGGADILAGWRHDRWTHGGTLSDRTGRPQRVLAGLATTTLVITVVPAITVPTPFAVLLVVLGFTLFAVRPVVLALVNGPQFLGGRR